jgi:hypothetical protein
MANIKQTSIMIISSNNISLPYNEKHKKNKETNLIYEGCSEINLGKLLAKNR